MRVRGHFDKSCSDVSAERLWPKSILFGRGGLPCVFPGIFHRQNQPPFADRRKSKIATATTLVAS